MGLHNTYTQSGIIIGLEEGKKCQLLPLEGHQKIFIKMPLLVDSSEEVSKSGQ